jgi:putative tryptophan/tyrosine transport system substrate-binding protein
MKRRQFIWLLGGTTVAWPLAGRAQDHAFPAIGFLHPGSPQRNTDLVAAFRRGLSEAGYVDGRNVAIEYCWGDDRFDRMPGLAADLVRRNVAVIIVTSTAATLAVTRMTLKIPVVFNFASDPVELGLAASLSRPGGNVTGITSSSAELAPKQLELLHEWLPAASTVALLVNPSNSTFAENLSRDIRVAARTRGLQLRIVHASTEREFDEAFARLAQLRADGLLISPDVLFDGRIEQIAALTVGQALPAIYQFREFAAAGGLTSYGTIHTEPYREAGVYAGKILAGANPGDLPVQQPTKFKLVVNLKTAKVLGLDVPRQLLVRADEVVE